MVKSNASFYFGHCRLCGRRAMLRRSDGLCVCVDGPEPPPWTWRTVIAVLLVCLALSALTALMAWGMFRSAVWLSD